jgi:RNA 2',3'-cyclic 3'-phosphodiesterase
VPDGAQPTKAVADRKRDRLRLFLAVDVPARQKASVEQAIGPLRPELPGARWVAPEGWHVTLKFFGEVPKERLAEVREKISDAVMNIGAVESQLTDFGAFPNLRRARVLWVGIADPVHVLGDLASRVEAGWPDANPRPLHLHLTLARFNKPARVEWAVDGSPAVNLDRATFLIEKATLFQSHLGRAGARYESLAEFPLSGLGGVR